MDECVSGDRGGESEPDTGPEKHRSDPVGEGVALLSRGTRKAASDREEPRRINCLTSEQAIARVTHDKFLVYLIVMRIIGQDNQMLPEVDPIDEDIMPDMEPPAAGKGFF